MKKLFIAVCLFFAIIPTMADAGDAKKTMKKYKTTKQSCTFKYITASWTTIAKEIQAPPGYSWHAMKNPRLRDLNISRVVCYVNPSSVKS